MFKRFSADDGITSSQIKNSAQRSIISQIVELYPSLEGNIEEILPKKAMLLGKGQDGMQLLIVNSEIVFYCPRDGVFMPSLRLLHKYPNMMQKMQVDKGAIRFILGGANIMCPGFTSPGGNITVPVEVEQPVAIYAEGKVHALAVGVTKMSTNDIKTIGKGIAVETIHYLMDGLWMTKSV
jgi:PUA domain protein